MQREINEKVAFEPLNRHRCTGRKTDTGTGVTGMQPGGVASAEFRGQLKSNLDWKGNKEIATGLTLEVLTNPIQHLTLFARQ